MVRYWPVSVLFRSADRPSVPISSAKQRDPRSKIRPGSFWGVVEDYLLHPHTTPDHIPEDPVEMLSEILAVWIDHTTKVAVAVAVNCQKYHKFWTE